MENQKPLVSIIMPAYNAERHISDSIESILAQSYTNWELLITDDCSTDDTPKILQSLAQKDERIILLKNEHNSGPAVSRNKSIRNASGRFIAFLDSDDRWVPNKLEEQIAFMLENDFSFTYTDYWITDSEGNKQRERGIPERVDYHNLLKTNYIGCLTAIYDTQVLGKQLMPLIRKRQDFGLWLKLLKQTQYAYGLNKPLAYYRVHESSLSSNKLDAAKHTWKLYREVEKLGLVKSIYYFLNYSIRGMLRS